MKKGSADIMILILLVVILIGLVIFFGIKFTSTKIENNASVTSTVEEKAEVSNVIKSNVEVTKGIQIEEAKSIAQDLYSKVYSLINEGIGLKDGDIVKINIGNAEVEAYKLDFSKIEGYITENCMRYVMKYSDERTTEGYYRTLNNIHNSSGLLDFIYTIFGTTDQGVRDLEVKIFDENTIVAKSLKSGKMFEKYIIFVKENGTWKIDMFE